MRARSLVLRLTALVAVAAISAPAAFAQTAPAYPPVPPAATLIRDARESAPAALLGVWKADVPASTYPGAPPREQFRTFQYSADGRILVSFMTLSTEGRVSSGHWSIRLDGDPGLEYFSGNGMTPYAVIQLKQRDPRTFDLTNGHYGVTASSAVYRLSEDGATLTIERMTTGGARTAIVYRRWGAL